MPRDRSRSRSSVENPLPMDQLNAAFQQMRDTGVNLNGPEHVSASEQRRRQLRVSQQLHLHPTYYMYDTPQDGSTLCELCRLNETNDMKRLFVGHDDNDPNH